MTDGLFRKEVLARQGERLWGELLHIKAINYSFLSVLIVLVTVGALIFLVKNDYYRKQEVRGQLVSDKAMIVVGPANSGILVSLNTAVNGQVQSGEVVFGIQEDASVSKNTFYTDAILHNLWRRRENLHSQIDLETLRQQNRQKQQVRQLEILKINSEQLNNLIRIENQLLQLKKADYTRVEHLVRNKMLARIDSEKSYSDYLQRQSALENTLLKKSELEMRERELQSSLENSNTESRLSVLALESELTNLDQEILSVQSRIYSETIAPITGTVSSINAEIGEFVSAQDAVMIIRPIQSKIAAELFVPSRAIGFLKLGQQTHIRLDAFPYQKFGVQSGEVASISNSVLLPDEIPRNMNINEPVYQVTIALDAQSIHAFGEEIPLRPGILLDANIILEKRNLLEWLLEPLFSVLNNNV